MRKPRVFHLLPEDEPFSAHRGGAISRVVANLLSEDENALILCPSADDSWPFPAAQVHKSLLLRCYGAVSALHYVLLRIKPMLRAMLSVALTEAQRGDTVWVHNRVLHAILLNPLAARRGLRLVLHMHNSTGWKPAMAVPLRGVTVVFVSRALAEGALADCPDLTGIEILHNGADPAIYHPGASQQTNSSERELQVLFVGRLIPEKGAHVLKEAMRLLEQRSIPARVHIVGSVAFSAGGRSAYIDSLTLDAPGSMVFEGYRSGAELARAYREADVFCCPSTWNEPFGMVIVEAMATGLPVIATNVGGIPEVLAHGGGILVPPADAALLADALGFLAGDSKARVAMGQAAFESFRSNFTWSAIRRQYQMILGKL